MDSRVLNNFLIPLLIQDKADLVLAGECKLGGGARIISDWLDKRLRNLPTTPGASHGEPTRYKLDTDQGSVLKDLRALAVRAILLVQYIKRKRRKR